MRRGFSLRSTSLGRRRPPAGTCPRLVAKSTLRVSDTQSVMAPAPFQFPGSSASRRPSPNEVGSQARSQRIRTPGKVTTHHARKDELRVLRQHGAPFRCGGCAPIPRKPKSQPHQDRGRKRQGGLHDDRRKDSFGSTVTTSAGLSLPLRPRAEST